MGGFDYNGLWGMLKAAGWSTYRIRRDKLIGNGTLMLIRRGEPISGQTVERLCELLHCQPGDLMRYVSDAEEAAEKGATTGEPNI